jgi:hypothetical protein
MDRRPSSDEPPGMAASKFRALVRRLAGPTLPLPATDRRLIHCPRCGTDTCNPVRWYEHDAAHWWIRLRCGECAAVRDVIATDDEAERLDRDLQVGVTEIATTLMKLDRGPARRHT